MVRPWSEVMLCSYPSLQFFSHAMRSTPVSTLSRFSSMLLEEPLQEQLPADGRSELPRRTNAEQVVLRPGLSFAYGTVSVWTCFMQSPYPKLDARREVIDSCNAAEWQGANSWQIGATPVPKEGLFVPLLRATFPPQEISVNCI
jgi:hypothetical protein